MKFSGVVGVTLPFIIPSLLTPLLIIYGLILFIHGLLALLSYHKCKKYEIFIREFKQSLHSNDKFFEQHQDRYRNMYRLRNKLKNEKAEILMNVLSNPSNNTFAYIGFQRYLNVKRLELENDKFTRSRAALTICISKYWLLSLVIFSVIVFDHDLGLFGGIWIILLIHLFDFFGYCYFIVAEGSDPKKVLKLTIKYMLLYKILLV